MNGKKVNLREVYDKYTANCKRIGEIADLCEKEKRERNDEENKEYEMLVRENQVLQMRMQVAAGQYMTEQKDTKAEAEKLIRENAAAGRQTEIRLMRDLVMVANAAPGGIVPVKLQDILDPLVEGLILDKVGLPMPTGLSGDYVWPVYEAVEATIVGEGVPLTDTPVEMSKLTAAPQRIGIAIPVTREAINQTSGVLEMVVRKLMPQALSMLLNKIMFSTAIVHGATTLKGPFVDLKTNADTHTFAAAVPTFIELNTMKADILKTGIDGEHLCWVMTKSMKAILEGTPINEKGIYLPMIQNGMLCGLPVFTTNYIGEGYVGLGDWRYQPMGLFGDISFVVDPYTQARKNAVDFVLNADYGTTTLRSEAFALKKVGPGK